MKQSAFPITPFLLATAVLITGTLWAVDAPLFEDIHVVSLPVKTYGYRGMPGDIIALKDGRLLLAYTHMTESGDADGSIAARYSADQGKTWAEEFILIPANAPKYAQEVYCHPSFVRTGNDQILLTYIYRSSMEPLFGHNYYRRSADETRSWGDQLIVTPHAGYNIIHNNKLLRLSDGRLVAPGERQARGEGGDHSGYVSFVMHSDDNGYSWWESENTVNMLPIEAQEPQIVELKDGRLMMLMRTYSHFIARAYSDDRGVTWSKGELVDALTLPTHTSSALNVARIPDTGDLLVLRCNGGPDEPHLRTPFVSVLSKDDGETWVSERVIMGEPDNDYGYPSLMFLDGVALISYHQRDGLHVLRVGVDWFYGE